MISLVCGLQHLLSNIWLALSSQVGVLSLELSCPTVSIAAQMRILSKFDQTCHSRLQNELAGLRCLRHMGAQEESLGEPHIPADDFSSS